MSLAIIGMGTSTPQRTMTQRQAAEGAKTFCCQNDRQARLLTTVFDRSEVHTRASVILEHEPGTPIQQSFFPAALSPEDRGPTTSDRMDRYTAEAPAIAICASRAALAEAGIAPAEITHLVTVSCTGFFAPGVDIAMIRELGLPPTTLRTHVGFMGCHGAINGLRVAAAITGADPNARVLLSAVELCSLHFSYGWDVERVKANALFADGSASVVCVGARHGNGNAAWQLVATGSCIFHDSENAMTWRIGNNGFEMTLSAEVPALIEQNLRGWLEPWLAQNGLSLGDVVTWAIHPGGPRIVSAVLESLGLPEETAIVSRQVLAEYGNMSSPTILFILDRLRRDRTEGPCVAIGFGPGLVAEAALLV